MTAAVLISWRHSVSRLLWVFGLAMGILAVYRLQIAETNAYMGYVLFPLDAGYAFAILLSLLLVSVVISIRIDKPSDFFRLLYSLFVLLPYVVLHGIRGEIVLSRYFMDLAVLVLPVLLLAISSPLVPAIRMPGVLKQGQVLWILLWLCLLGLLYALYKAPASAGFGLADVYTRRLEGRDIFPDRSFFAYLNMAIVNGFAPLLAFMGGWLGRWRYFMFALLCAVAYYYVIGLKLPVVFVLLSFLLGYAGRRGRLRDIGMLICGLLLALFLVFLFEYLIFGFSYVGDYFFRRAYGVSAFMMAVYFDFVSASGASMGWSMLNGIEASQPVSFVIGEQVLGDPGLNANTNSLLHALADGGVLAYAATVLLVIVVFLILDSAYKSKGNPVLLYLGFLYAILLTEQAATIALISSGVGVLILLFLFARATSSAMATRQLSY
ncbi:hypothetical protein H0484_05605 [Pusillimonas sp. CC-YST705]|uniref:Uncharacterized protein n=1 Tax=Mesopusillimonas faecipullorum TaxID=2755040 RepID=A0ABS8CB30_9BURK|nr:hypothetical protein [Mesopusillimonas faecipullorum]MCB5363231.1 hypothetical protein [Mesopusillimonas faecipullorum]